MAVFSRYYLIFACLLPLIPAYIGFRLGVGLVNLQRLLFLPLAFLTYWVIATKPSVRVGLKRVVRDNRQIFNLLLLFLVFRVIGSFFSVDASSTLKTTIYELFFFISLLFSTLLFVNKETNLRRLVRVLCASLIFVSLLAGVERAVEQNIFLQFVNASDSDDYLTQALTAKIRGDYRVQATFYNPLSFAHYVLAILPFLYFGARDIGLRRIRWVAIALALASLWFTGSRAAVLILAGEVFLYIYSRLQKLRRSSYGLVRLVSVFFRIAAILIMVGALSFGFDKIAGGSEEEASSSLARLIQLAQGLVVIGENPLFGVGARLAANYMGVSVNEERVSVDNYYLSLAVENGVPALLMFVALLYKVLRTTFRVGSISFGVALIYSFLAIFGFFLISSLYDEMFPILVILIGILCHLNSASIASGRMRENKC